MTTFSDALSKNVDSVINNFIDKVSNNYKLNKQDLIQIWNGSGSSSSPKAALPVVSANSELVKMSKSELITLCKCKGFKVSGTKTDLINRIEQAEVNKVNNKLNLVKQTPIQTPITKKLVEKIPEILIRKNKFGNFEHADSSFVIDKITKKVIGKQNPDGSIDSLCHDDINICNKYKFEYVLPLNLDKAAAQTDDADEEEFEEVEVEDELEIEEDDLEDEEEEVEEEELEEEYYEE